MVQTVTLELSALNNIPGVSGVEDVTFDIPELEDIRREIDDAVPSLDEIEGAVEGLLDSAVDTILDEIPVLEDIDDIVARELDEALGNFDEQVSQAVEEALNAAGAIDISDIQVDIEGSLFSLQEDFVDILAQALSEAALGDIPEFPDLTSIEELLNDILSDVEDLDVPSVAEIEEAVQTAVEDAQQDIQIPDLLESADALVDAVVDALEDRLIGEEEEQALQRLEEVFE